MKTTDNRIAGATKSPVYQLKGWNWLGVVDWKKRKREEPAGTPCGKWGYLAYCAKCGIAFSCRDFLKATDTNSVCEDCTAHSRNLAPANAFSPDRKLCK